MSFPPASMLETGVRYSVFVSHVVDGPKSFFVQIVSGGGNRQFDQLMDDIAESYMTLGTGRLL